MAAEDRIRQNQVKSPGNIRQDEHEDIADARRVLLVDGQGDTIDSGNRLPVDAIINISPGAGVDTPTIFNVLMPLADTEYSQALPIGTRKFEMRVREEGKLKVSYVATTSGSNYWTIRSGGFYSEDGVDLTAGITVYFQCPKPGLTVELKTWS